MGLVDRVEPEVARVLAEHHTMTLATAEGSRPWASQVFYAEEFADSRLILYFASLKPSRKWSDLRKNPIVSFAVGTEAPTRWLQGGGVAEPIEDAVEKRRITEAITIKTPVYDKFISLVSADFFRIVVDELRVVDLTEGAPKTIWKRTRPVRPRGIGGFVAATRAQVLPVTLAPVVLGATFAWRRSGSFSLSLFALTILGAAALHLAANVINDLHDIRSGADRVADALEGTLRTGSPFATHALAVALLGAGAACGIALVVADRPLALAFGLAGAVLAYTYVAQPVALGYRGHGLGEVAILIAFGPLPVAGSYYVQAGNIPSAAWLLGLLPGILSTRILFHHHFLHYKADRLAGKMTPVAVWGPEAMLSFARSSLLFDVILLVGLAVLDVIPWLGVLAIVSFIPLWRGLSSAIRKKSLSAYGALLRGSVATSVGAQGLLTVAIILFD
jgi:1,4-dihydroxy-2-naphthoate octaprenyltransferase